MFKCSQKISREIGLSAKKHLCVLWNIVLQSFHHAKSECFDK